MLSTDEVSDIEEGPEICGIVAEKVRVVPGISIGVVWMAVSFDVFKLELDRCDAEPLPNSCNLAKKSEEW